MKTIPLTGPVVGQRPPPTTTDPTTARDPARNAPPTDRDARTQAPVRPDGALAPTEAERSRPGNLIAERSQQRRTRGRTAALKLMPLNTLMAQARKPVVRSELKQVLQLAPELRALLSQHEA